MAARRVLETSGAVKLMIDVIRTSIPEQRLASPELPAEFWTRLEARVIAEAPLLVDSIAVLYANTFTLPELQALIAFHMSPVGVRMAAAQPRIIAEMGLIGRRWGERLGAAVAAGLSP